MGFDIKKSIRRLFNYTNASFLSASMSKIRQKLKKICFTRTAGDGKRFRYAQEFYTRKKSLKLSPKITSQTLRGFISSRFSLSRLKIRKLPKLTINPVYRKTALATMVLAVILIGGMFLFNTEKTACSVLVNGQQVALVESAKEAEKVFDDLKAVKAKTWKQRVTVGETVTFKQTKARWWKVKDIQVLTKILDEKLTFLGAATGIKIDGTVKLVVRDKAAADKVLNQLEQSFVPSGINVTSIRFAQKVEIAEVPVNLKEVVEPDKALEILKFGGRNKSSHRVAEGDSLWSIARQYDMRVADLKSANPDLNGEKLSVGQELNLVKVKPLVDVLLEGQITTKETVPYKVVVEKNRSMWQGRQKLKQSGENGFRQATYKLVLKNGTQIEKNMLSENVIKPARDQVIVKGSRLIVASRQGGSKLGWPTEGKINSDYGRRWGRQHTGLDIDGNKGEPIAASADGRVISAGWDGGYGNAVVISHGNGLVTKYAHMSKIEVEPGQRISRGDLIGLVGSTGNSTGPHVHFEVILDGTFQNPLRFLR